MSYKAVTFVIPDGFTGPFAVIERPDGINIDAREIECRIEVPSSRVVALRSADVLREMRRWRLVTVPGKEIDVYEVGDDAQTLRGGGYFDRTGHLPRFEFFVGTLQESESFDFPNWQRAAELK